MTSKGPEERASSAVDLPVDEEKADTPSPAKDVRTLTGLKLYSLYDGKWLYIISAIVFMAASAVCGAAPNIVAEIVGRVFAGAGGNGMYFGLLTLLSTHTTNRERPAYLSLTYILLMFCSPPTLKLAHAMLGAYAGVLGLFLDPL
ncbi:MAG: hypothetical protein Q9176_007942 [Flavoplaca citrina]